MSVYGPDNGWYYRITGARIDRAYPLQGRGWERTEAGSRAYKAIKALVASGGVPESSEKQVKLLLRESKKEAKRQADTPVIPYTPSPYTPVSSPTFLAPEQGDKKALRDQRAGRAQQGGGSSGVLPLVGIGVGGLLAVGGLLYVLSRMQGE